jgi:hypothetical protein
MHHFFFWMSASFASASIFASFFEWALHRYIMHRPFGKFEYPFRAHALVHHRIFRADHSYHLIREEDKSTIPMAWWNGPVLIMAGTLPYLLASILTGNWGLICGSVLAGACYYGTYEYLHWCMHLPKRRHVERSGIYFRLNGHHLLHHRYMGKNFNVVFPLADLVLGTLLLRSRVQFKQAEGPSVPNVQPRPRREGVKEFVSVE